MAQAAIPTMLRHETRQIFGAYVRDAETEMQQTLIGGGKFLWADANPERAKDVQSGKVVAQFWSGKGPLKIPDALIHDWIGAAFISSATVEDVLAVIQDYKNYPQTYAPEVIASKVLSHHGDEFQVYLRLLKKKILTVILETEHEVQYGRLDRQRWVCRSCTTRVSEVENAGSAKERVLPPDTGHGFLWRLNSYWRFQQREPGVYIECRAISLTRDVPYGMGWFIEPIVQKLPKESLVATLEATRRVLQAT